MFRAMNKELAKTIGSAARIARKALRLSQEDVAERIDVSVEFYGRIERGASLPSILTFVRIVHALNTSADYLLGSEAFATKEAFLRAPEEAPEIRRLLRRLRKAKPLALRFVSLLLKELEGDKKPLSCRSLDVSLELKELDLEEPVSYDPRASITPARR